ncbi:MAG TPA: DUF6691 family protein [Gammaproteobacteria bacterium]
MLRRVIPYLLAGVLFGLVLVKSEAASWYRIQEMFHFQAFHMFGIMGSAVLTAFVGVRLMRRLLGRASLEGAPIQLPRKGPGRVRYLAGGAIFGVGWGLIGLCPGPIFALVGTGSPAALLVLAGALHGTWLYGVLHRHLPQ